MSYDPGRGGRILVRVPDSISTTVNITAASGRAVTVYSDVTRTTSVAMPDVITAAKYYFVDRDDRYVVSVVANSVEVGYVGDNLTPATLTLSGDTLLSVRVSEEAVQQGFPGVAVGEFARHGAKVYDPIAYGVTFDGITDDTAAWNTLIAALPADIAHVPVHGPTVVSASAGKSYALGFDTANLTLEATSSAAKFILAPGSNCNVIRVNTSGLNTNPPRLSRVALRGFRVDHQGFTQADPGSGIGGAVVIWACDEVDIDGVRIYNARSSGITAQGCRQVRLHGKGLIDTVVPGGGANGVSVTGTAQMLLKPVSDYDVDGWEFIDCPGDSAFIGGFNTGRAQARGCKVRFRNMLPNISGSPPASFTPLAAMPATYDATHTYASGDLVYYTDANTRETLLFQASQSSNTGNTPAIGSAFWTLGAIRGGVGGALACEGGPATPSVDLSFIGNQVDGRNAAGQFAGWEGVLCVNTSGVAGESIRAAVISANTIRGTASWAIAAPEMLANVTGNVCDDVTNGIILGSGLNQPTIDHIAANNIVRLGGKGGGTGIRVGQPNSNAAYPLHAAQLAANIVDGGARGPQTLTTALTTGVAVTTLATSPMGSAAPAGSIFAVANLPQNSSASPGVVVTLAQPCVAGDTTLTVNSVTPAGTVPAAAPIKACVASTTADLTAAAPVTSVPVAALLNPIQQGCILTLLVPGTTLNTGNSQVTVTADANIGATALTITSFTPGTTIPAGSGVAVLGNAGLALAGNISRVSVKGGDIGNLANDGVQLTTSGLPPQNVEIDSLWAHDSLGKGLNMATSASTRFVWRGGGLLNNGAGNTIAGAGANAPALIDIAGVNPVGNLSPPAVPTSNGGTGTTNTTFSGATSPVLLFITANAAGSCTVYIAPTTGNPASSLVIPASATVPVHLFPTQKFGLNYANAPTFPAMVGL